MAKQQNTTNSLQDLAKLTGMQPETTKQKVADNSQNFYSFLHKRNRFYDSDVITINPNNQRETVHHKKYEIKKIHVEKSVPSGNRPKHLEITQEFKGWQNTEFYQAFAQRHKTNAEILTNNQLKIQNFKPDWRLAIGLGTGSVFETSISLHPVYGFPYIPASAVKGVLRSFLITELWKMEKNSEAKAFHESQAMCDIFGCGEETIYDGNKRMATFYKRCFDEDKQRFGKDKSKYRYPDITEKIGGVIFFDAYPCESPNGKIKADIMNNHYQPYYNGDAPPADYHKLNPIFFLTVENLTFQFMVGLHKDSENNNITLDNENGDMLTVVSKYLKDALTQRGIGAKTAVGYGYMQ